MSFGFPIFPASYSPIDTAFSSASPVVEVMSSEGGPSPPAWQTWLIGLLFVTLCSFSAPIGIAFLPCLSKRVYERLMVFLVALGIGTLSGSWAFNMLPQAFDLREAGDDYLTKVSIILIAIYGFFFLDRVLQYVLEWKRVRRQQKVHAPSLKNWFATVNNHAESEDGKKTSLKAMEKNNTEQFRTGLSTNQTEIEMALVNNIIARSFSSRRRIAVVKAIDDLEYQGDNVDQTSRVSVKAKKDLVDLVNQDLADGGMSRKEDTKRELAIDVEVVEKKVIERADMEISSVAYIIVIGNSLNNFLDGMSMGVSFAGSISRGVSIALASLSQQFPQELGVLAILIDSGLGVRRTLLINCIPATTSFVGFVIGVFLNNIGQGFDSYIFATSAGMYLYVFLGTLLPEIRESSEYLIKHRLKESFLVTILQFFGILGGVLFIFGMSITFNSE